jgi:hypothetical protein
MRQPGSTRHEDWVVPPLFDVVPVRCSLDVLELRGIECVKNTWHLQIWSCRFATAHEIQTAVRMNNIGFEVEFARYRHWWPRLVGELRERDPKAYVMSVADAREILDISQDEMWPFIRWLGDTRRGYISGGGADGLGMIAIKDPGDPEAHLRPDPRFGEVEP